MDIYRQNKLKAHHYEVVSFFRGDKMKKNIQQFFIILLTNLASVIFMNVYYATNIYFDGILIHALLYMSLVYAIISITKRINLSYIIVNSLEWLFSIISVLKIETRGQEFVPWDLYLIGNVFDLINFAQLTPEIVFNILSQTVLIIAITIIQIYVFKEFCQIPEKRRKSIYYNSNDYSVFIFSYEL